VLIRSFIFSKINTYRLPKFTKISFAINIFVNIRVQEMVCLKAIQKNHASGRFCVGNHRSKNLSENIERGFSSLKPPGAPMHGASDHAWVLCPPQTESGAGMIYWY